MNITETAFNRTARADIYKRLLECSKSSKRKAVKLRRDFDKLVHTAQKDDAALLAELRREAQSANDSPN